MLRLRSGPQDLPAGLWVALITGGLYIATGAAALVAGGETKTDLAISTDLAGMLLVVLLALRMTGRPQRVAQTLSALFGCGSVFNMLAIPFLATMDRGGDATASPDGLTALAWWGLFFWSLWVNGHVLRHALEIRLSSGIALASLMFLLSTLAYLWGASL